MPDAGRRQLGEMWRPPTKFGTSTIDRDGPRVTSRSLVHVTRCTLASACSRDTFKGIHPLFLHQYPGRPQDSNGTTTSRETPEEPVDSGCKAASLEGRVLSHFGVDTPELLALLREILVFEPSQRPGVSKILDHLWFGGHEDRPPHLVSLQREMAPRFMQITLEMLTFLAIVNVFHDNCSR